MPWNQTWHKPDVYGVDILTARIAYKAYLDGNYNLPMALPYVTLKKPSTIGEADEDYILVDLRGTQSWNYMTLSIEDRLKMFLASDEYWSVLFDGKTCPKCGKESIADVFIEDDPLLKTSRITCHACGLKWPPSRDYYTAQMAQTQPET